MINQAYFKALLTVWIALLLGCVSSWTFAGSQREEPLSNSVKALMQRSISDKAVPRLVFSSPEEGNAWLNDMSQRLKKTLARH